MKTGCDGMRAESSFALVRGTGASCVEPSGRAGGDGGPEYAFSDSDGALPAVFCLLGILDGTGVQEALGFLEILPGGGFTEGGFVNLRHRTRRMMMARRISMQTVGCDQLVIGTSPFVLNE